MDRAIDDEETLNIAAEKTEDHMFLRNKAPLQDKRTTLQVNYGRQPSFKNHAEAILKPVLASKGKETYDEKYYKILKDSFDKIYPLIYLNSDQRKMVIDGIKILKFEQKQFS